MDLHVVNARITSVTIIGGPQINAEDAMPEFLNSITAMCSMVAAIASLLLAIRRGRRND